MDVQLLYEKRSRFTSTVGKILGMECRLRKEGHENPKIDGTIAKRNLTTA